MEVHLIKPLTRLGLNTHSLTYVTDDRHANFNDSLIGIVEASLQDGPAFFNCFPNFSVSLTDKNLKQSLCLGIQTTGFDMPNSEHIALVYRIYYKAMNSIIPNIAYARQIHGTTTLFLTNFSNKVITPKPIKWDQIDFEHTWTIPRNNKSQPKENDQVQNIIERPDGTVIINFNPKPSNIVESRPSMSARPSTSSTQNLENLSNLLKHI